MSGARDGETDRPEPTEAQFLEAVRRASPEKQVLLMAAVRRFQAGMPADKAADLMLAEMKHLP